MVQSPQMETPINQAVIAMLAEESPATILLAIDQGPLKFEELIKAHQTADHPGYPLDSQESQEEGMVERQTLERASYHRRQIMKLDRWPAVLVEVGLAGGDEEELERVLALEDPMRL